MNLFNGTKYPESAKSAENDRLHLLMCDNGSLTLSHKESGRVFFEFPTRSVGFHRTFPQPVPYKRGCFPRFTPSFPQLVENVVDIWHSS
jgi:hypothetical protein